MDFLPIRLSHVLSHSGVGAIVRGPDGLVVVHDVRTWTDRNDHAVGSVIPYVERVRAALQIAEQLREPPVAKELRNGKIDGTCIPVTRFPSWMRCPSSACGALYYKPWKEQNTDRPCCTHENCKRKPHLEQVPWVLAHKDGYLADVPWDFLAHRYTSNPRQQQCRIEGKLQLLDRGYDRRELYCGACKIRSAFDGDERMGFGTGPMQPWTWDDKVQAREIGDANPAQVLSVNDTRVYAPVTDVALVIPPESRLRKGTVVDRLYRNSGDRQKIDSARNSLQRSGVLRKLATPYRCTVTEVEDALEELQRGYPLYGATFTPGMLRESEFLAFGEVLPDLQDDEDFVNRDQSEKWRVLTRDRHKHRDGRDLADCVPTLIRVDRLSAVKVFRGFRRLGGDAIVRPDIVGQSDWLPAVKLHGEGLFISLNEQRIADWEQHPAVSERLAPLSARFEQSGREAPNPLTARFLMLHTLSHLLMREIESEGGYPAASLTERIYCASGPNPMAGILVYVAVPDVAGSLGGLAELAEPERFLPLLTHALEHSRWCSLDPVCSEHEGQGPGLLNRAACHACALVPEPACEYGNTLLDRVFVKGDEANGFPSLFGAESTW